VTARAVRLAAVLAVAFAAGMLLAVVFTVRQGYPAQELPSAPASFWPCPAGQHFTRLPNGKYGCLDNNGRWPG
jgi:hypothetical protein